MEDVALPMSGTLSHGGIAAVLWPQHGVYDDGCTMPAEVMHVGCEMQEISHCWMDVGICLESLHYCIPPLVAEQTSTGISILT